MQTQRRFWIEAQEQAVRKASNDPNGEISPLILTEVYELENDLFKRLQLLRMAEMHEYMSKALRKQLKLRDSYPLQVSVSVTPGLPVVFPCHYGNTLRKGSFHTILTMQQNGKKAGTLSTSKLGVTETDTRKG